MAAHEDYKGEKLAGAEKFTFYMKLLQRTQGYIARGDQQLGVSLCHYV